MEAQTNNIKIRRDLKCLSLGETAYSMCKTLAKEAGLSVSAYLRLLIQKNFKRNKNKLSLEVKAE